MIILCEIKQTQSFNRDTEPLSSSDRGYDEAKPPNALSHLIQLMLVARAHC